MDTNCESHRTPISWIALGVSSILALAACSGAVDEVPNKMVPPSVTSDPAPTPESPNAASESAVEHDTDAGQSFESFYGRWDGEKGDYPAKEGKPEGWDDSNSFAEMREERDQFLIDQKLPLDGGLWSATTGAQKALIEYAGANIEARGGIFNEYNEDITLLLGIDACLAAIENLHDIDQETFENYVAKSSHIQRLVREIDAEPQEAERRLVSFMTVGMYFLCPNDHDAWREHYYDSYETVDVYVNGELLDLSD